MAYDYLDQNIVASALIQPHDNDSFYNPEVDLHTGFAADGTRYTNGVQDMGPVFASWYLESQTGNPYRGDGPTFPKFGIILLSPVSMVILDEGTPTLDPQKLALWMQFLLGDTFALANNFDGALNGWTPSGLAYANGVISVIYFPDEGNIASLSPPISADSNMVVNIDFAQDKAYLDIAT